MFDEYSVLARQIADKEPYYLVEKFDHYSEAKKCFDKYIKSDELCDCELNVITREENNMRVTTTILSSATEKADSIIKSLCEI